MPSGQVVSPRICGRGFSPPPSRKLCGHKPIRWLAATLLFSAKEASYKAWALKGALAFREIEIALEQDGFVAAARVRALRGRYAVEKDVMLVAAWR